MTDLEKIPSVSFDDDDEMAGFARHSKISEASSPGGSPGACDKEDTIEEEGDGKTHTTAASSPGGSPGALDEWLARPELYTSATDSSEELDDEVRLAESVPTLMHVPSAGDERYMGMVPTLREQSRQGPHTIPSFVLGPYSSREEVQGSVAVTETTGTTPGGCPGYLDEWLAQPECHSSYSFDEQISASRTASSVPNRAHSINNDDERSAATATRKTERFMVDGPCTSSGEYDIPIRPTGFTPSLQSSEDKSSNRFVVTAPESPQHVPLIGGGDSTSNRSSEFSSVKWANGTEIDALVEELENYEEERGSAIPPAEGSEGELVLEPATLPIPVDLANRLINVEYVTSMDSISGMGDLSSVDNRITKDVARDVFNSRVVPQEIPIKAMPGDVSTLCGGRYDDETEHDDVTYVSETEVALTNAMEQGVKVATSANAHVVTQAAPSSSWFDYFTNFSRTEVIFLVLIGISAAVLIVLVITFI